MFPRPKVFISLALLTSLIPRLLVLSRLLLTLLILLLWFGRIGRSTRKCRAYLVDYVHPADSDAMVAKKGVEVAGDAWLKWAAWLFPCETCKSCSGFTIWRNICVGSRGLTRGKHGSRIDIYSDLALFAHF